METFTMLKLNVFLAYKISNFHLPISETKLIHNTFSFVSFFPPYIFRKILITSELKTSFRKRHPPHP